MLLFTSSRLKLNISNGIFDIFLGFYDLYPPGHVALFSFGEHKSLLDPKDLKGSVRENAIPFKIPSFIR